MSLFGKRRTVIPVPKECEGLDIRVESSVCTGERVIGFRDPRSGKLLCSELVRSDDDITAFYAKYGRQRRKQ